MILSSAYEVDDLERVSFFQQRRSMGLAGNDIPIELDHDSSGPNLQFLKERGDAQPIRDVG